MVAGLDASKKGIRVEHVRQMITRRKHSYFFSKTKGKNQRRVRPKTTQFYLFDEASHDWSNARFPRLTREQVGCAKPFLIQLWRENSSREIPICNF